MVEFIKGIVEAMNFNVWFWIVAGAVGLVFVFGIIMTIIKRKGFPIGRSTAIATVLAAIAIPMLAIVTPEGGDAAYYTVFMLAVGSAISLIAGCISMIVSKKKRKCDRTSDGAKSEFTPDYFNEPASFDYMPDSSNDSFAQSSNQQPAAAQYSSPEVEALLSKINRICKNGAPLPEMRETAMQLQRERAKPENKNNPETYGKLNKALLDLLSVIQAGKSR